MACMRLEISPSKVKYSEGHLKQQKLQLEKRKRLPSETGSK